MDKVFGGSIGGGIVSIAGNETERATGVGREVGPGERSRRYCAVGKRDGVLADSSVNGAGCRLKRVVGV